MDPSRDVSFLTGLDVSSTEIEPQVRFNVIATRPFVWVGQHVDAACGQHAPKSKPGGSVALRGRVPHQLDGATGVHHARRGPKRQRHCVLSRRVTLVCCLSEPVKTAKDVALDTLPSHEGKSRHELWFRVTVVGRFTKPLVKGKLRIAIPGFGSS